ncbi:MAG: peptide-methionine (S)-S-oxide reductase MsrA [Rhodothermaceae bacterium]|nr:peptide-methionine (S)-S-oxide reductase MsrA [Rhodothermaceae bacterium]
MADNNLAVATIGGGCFWCIEAVFKPLKGITSLVSGYAGGAITNPTYRQVCNGDTGHAEVVQITFDPSEISFKEMIEIFLVMHDPTTLNRQGGDIGTQYRSTIMYHDDAQKQVAEEVIAAFTADKVYDDPIVTEVVPLDIFYPAEEYHQDYYANNSRQPYCAAVIAPKVAKLRKKYAERLAVA